MFIHFHDDPEDLSKEETEEIRDMPEREIEKLRRKVEELKANVERIKRRLDKKSE